MRIVSRIPRATFAALMAAALSLLMSSSLLGGQAWAAGVGTQAVVAQADVVAKPYDLALAPDGEFRILHFDAGLVNSVLVAKPWLLTVLIQGNDVVLQAKASSGTTQLVAYVGDAGTLWQVEIAAHPSAPTRIVVRAPGEEPAVQVVPSPGRPVAPTGQPAAAQDARLTAFLATLTPGQRGAFEAWQRSPTAAALAEWMAQLSPEQRAAFDALVQAHVVTVTSPLGPEANRPVPPPLVDTTTVIGQPTVPAQPEGGAARPPVAVITSATPIVSGSMAALFANAENVPQGITVTVDALPAKDGLEVRYAIHNGLGVSLADPHVVATDGQGHVVDVSGAPAGAIPGGKDASGVLTVRTSAFPVILRWTWDERATETILFMGRTVSRGTAAFNIVVTP